MDKREPDVLLRSFAKVLHLKLYSILSSWAVLHIGNPLRRQEERQWQGCSCSATYTSCFVKFAERHAGRSGQASQRGVTRSTREKESPELVLQTGRNVSNTGKVTDKKMQILQPVRPTHLDLVVCFDISVPMAAVSLSSCGRVCSAGGRRRRMKLLLQIALLSPVFALKTRLIVEEWSHKINASRQTMPAPCVGTKLKGGDFICDSVESLDECNGKYTTTGEGEFLQCQISGPNCLAVGPFCKEYLGVELEYLVVGGGGGGGSGGGGAGGLIQGKGLKMKAGDSLVVIVGGGGSGGGGGWKKAKKTPGSGGMSKLGSIKASGGGRGAGGRRFKKSGDNGGSGGGGGFDHPNVKRSRGKKGQGNRGGRTARRSYGAGGGGGGAGKAGKDAKKKHYGGAGGDGIPSDITGETKWYAGGGGGGVNKNGNKNLKNGGGLGGRGGGGTGSSWASEVKRGAVRFTGTDGEDNTGGGGGGTDPECRVGGAGGSGLVVVRYQSPVPLMVGGSITSKGGYQIHSFRNVGTTKLEYDPGLKALELRYLVVAGGGGAGGGGGGGGGVLQGVVTIKKGETWKVKVGKGGGAGQGGQRPANNKRKRSRKGGNSKLGPLVAVGGGRGADRSRRPGSGGSGGGGSYDQIKRNPGFAKPGQGHPGGISSRGSWGGSAGGGGAGAAGKCSRGKHRGGHGGDGIPSDITGKMKWYGGGGGGGVNFNGNKNLKNGGGKGGKGGGGRGSSFGSRRKRNTKKFTGSHGKKNTGGGGGGTDPNCKRAGRGGSGIVVVRYKSDVALLQGGSVKVVDGEQIHIFTKGTKTLQFA
eukprot:s4_g26.t1